MGLGNAPVLIFLNGGVLNFVRRDFRNQLRFELYVHRAMITTFPLDQRGEVDTTSHWWGLENWFYYPSQMGYLVEKRLLSGYTGYFPVHPIRLYGKDFPWHIVLVMCVSLELPCGRVSRASEGNWRPCEWSIPSSGNLVSELLIDAWNRGGLHIRRRNKYRIAGLRSEEKQGLLREVYYATSRTWLWKRENSRRRAMGVIDTFKASLIRASYGAVCGVCNVAYTEKYIITKWRQTNSEGSPP